VDIAFHLAWVWLPIILFIVSLFVIRLGSGGFLISVVLWLITIALVIGHFLPS